MTEEEMQHFNKNYITRKEFIEAAQELWRPIMNLTRAWEKLSHKDNDQTSVDYPFNGSFDEWIYQYAAWVDKLEKNFLPKTQEFKPTITVKDMKQILAVLDDDTQIVIGDKENSWWINVKEVELPSEGIFTLVLHQKDDFDTRQF